jgi:AraC family transcriptional regulator, transcriptional activator of the genes for pyochelin and ferripyochelin receptors
LIKILLTYQINEYNHLFLLKKPVWVDQKINSKDVDILHEVKNYLSQNYLDTLSLFDLSRRFMLNEFKLKYGFKKLFGMAVMQFVNEKRLEHSQKLLKETDKTIVEISQIIGYEHPGNFSSSFKKKFGYSPLFYKNKV